jgi:hypothetical protein
MVRPIDRSIYSSPKTSASNLHLHLLVVRLRLLLHAFEGLKRLPRIAGLGSLLFKLAPPASDLPSFDPLNVVACESTIRSLFVNLGLVIVPSWSWPKSDRVSSES